MEMTSQGIRFYFFDEDHLRCNWYGNLAKTSHKTLRFLFNRELFDYHPEYGFLAACPTNSGRSDKFSIALELRNLYHLDGGLFLSSLPQNSYWGWRSPQESPFIDANHTTLIFFLKNATATRKVYFLRYIFFLFCLNNAISSWQIVYSQNTVKILYIRDVAQG